MIMNCTRSRNCGSVTRRQYLFLSLWNQRLAGGIRTHNLGIATPARYAPLACFSVGASMKTLHINKCEPSPVIDKGIPSSLPWVDQRLQNQPASRNHHYSARCSQPWCLGESYAWSEGILNPLKLTAELWRPRLQLAAGRNSDKNKIPFTV